MPTTNNRPSNPTRRSMLLAASLVVVAGAAACAGPAGLNSSAGGTAQAGSGENQVVRIAYQKLPSSDLIVKNQGLLEKALPDHTIEWKAFDSGASVNTAFIAKAVDIGTIGSSPVARGLSAPLHIPYSVAYVLSVVGENEALVARKASGVTDVAGLKGKRVGTPFASTAHYSLLAALEKTGLKEGDVSIVDLQPQDILAAWQRGDIDAAYVWLPVLDTLRKDGTQLISSAQVAEQGKPTMDLAVVADDFATKNPQVVDAWRKAQVEGTRTILTDKAAAAKAVAAELNISEQDAQLQLEQAVFLTPEQQGSSEWLGTEGAPGGITANIHDAAEFLVKQKKADEAPALADVEKAVYTKGLPDALTK